MARMRVIGSSFDKGYRDDLNYNFGLLEALIGEANGLTDNLREEMLEKIYNLQQQINLLTGENIGELMARLNDSIQQALTAAQEARTAKTATEEATALATTATELAKASALLAEEKANYANEKAVLAQEAADNAIQEAANLSQLKVDVVKATQDANTATGNAKQAALDAQTATNDINIVLPNVTGLVNLKEWNIETDYKKNNFVTLEGNGYMALRDNKGIRPPSLPLLSNGDWAMYVQKGEKGEQGTGVTILGVLPDESALPPSGESGDAYLINGDLYVWSGTTNDWTNVGTIKGPKGDTGPQGPQGEQGPPGQDADLTEVNQEIANLQQTVTDNQQVVTEHLADLTLNVKNYGAIGDGEADDTQAFTDALADLKVIRDTYRLINNFTTNTGGNITLYIPPGTYKISNQLNVPKGTCIRGEKNCSVIFANISFTMFSILDDIPERIENGTLLNEDIYTSIENISLFGCKYGTNPFAVHSVDNASNGIVVDTHRYKITDCDIVGFPNKGIVVNSKYYGTIRDCKITHCGVGIFLDGGISKEITAIKITRNEIRLNGQGIMLNRGFGNTIIDNTIESNIANYLPSETEQPISYLSKGKALSLVNSHENIIRDNYIENHYTNILFYNAYNNQVNSNFLVAGALEGQQNQILFDGATNNNNLFYFNEMHSASGTDGLSSLITIYNYNSVEGNVFYTFNLDAILAQNNIWNSGFIGIETKSPTIIEPKSNRIYRNKNVKMFTLS